MRIGLMTAFADMLSWSGFVHADPAPFSAATVSALRSQYPNVKLLASFGGWNLDLPFRVAVPATFSANVAAFLETFDLDGADIDWE